MDIGKDLEYAYIDGYYDGINKALSIIEREMEFAKNTNPQMAMGMSQVKMSIYKEVEGK